MHTVKKNILNQISLVSLSLSITLSPCALLNSIKESSSAGREGEWEAGSSGRGRGRRGRMVRAKISISDFHILNTLIYLTQGLFKTQEKGEEGMGGGRGKGARVLMTFSLWNLFSIVSVVNILPKDSTCHHGHKVSELLNGHRWHYIHAHVDDLIRVRLRCFFAAICQCQQMIYCSGVRHCVTHSRMWSGLPLCQLPLFVSLHPECQFLCTPAEVHDLLEFTLGRMPLWGSVNSSL